MASEAKLLTLQFLQWVAARPRRYGEMREAWGSTCPLTCAWEDAIADDLVRHAPDGRLALTKRGQACLAATRVALSRP
ncbi:MAG TPA: hypothetical protein VJR70_02400 [Stellaceae bacterium]|nr:hypothetical protein [Stellaceae bacterium]